MKSIKEMDKRLDEREQEIERLNNIIDKKEQFLGDNIKRLEREVVKRDNIINKIEERLINDRLFFEDVYKKSHLSEEEFRKQCPYTIGSYDHSVEMLGKLQELKERNKV